MASSADRGSGELHLHSNLNDLINDSSALAIAVELISPNDLSVLHRVCYAAESREKKTALIVHILKRFNEVKRDHPSIVNCHLAFRAGYITTVEERRDFFDNNFD